jgi:hypothetical protein
MGPCKNDYPLTFRGEHQSALWVRTERFDGIPSIKLGNQRDDLPGSGKLLGSIICKRKSRPEQATSGKDKRKNPFHTGWPF